MLKISWERPNLGVADEVKDLFRKHPKAKKNEPPKFWTHKERLLVGSLLALTFLISVYFWFKGQNKLPEINLGIMGFGETIILEK